MRRYFLLVCFLEGKKKGRFHISALAPSPGPCPAAGVELLAHILVLLEPRSRRRRKKKASLPHPCRGARKGAMESEESNTQFPQRPPPHPPLSPPAPGQEARVVTASVRRSDLQAEEQQWHLQGSQ